MTVAFMRRLSRERQERVADIWLRLRRDPTGGYSGEEIAEAILARKRADGIPTTLAGEYGVHSPQWYRRFRLNDCRKTRPRTPGHVRDALRRANRRTTAAA